MVQREEESKRQGCSEDGEMNYSWVLRRDAGTSCICIPHLNNFEERRNYEDMQKDRDGKVQACPADADELLKTQGV